MPSVLITGANQGLDLEFTRQHHAADGWRVIARCRSPESADALNEPAAGDLDIPVTGAR